MATSTYPQRTGTDRRADFLAVFPTIVDELLEYMKQERMPEDAVAWFKEVSYRSWWYCGMTADRILVPPSRSWSTTRREVS